MITKKTFTTAIIIIIGSLIHAQAIDSVFYNGSYKLDKSSIDSEGNEFINVTAYNIDYLQIIPEKKLLRASVKINIKSSKNINSFYLDFHNSYKIQSLKVNGLVAEWKFEHGHNLFIKPNIPIIKNTDFVVEVKYFNTDEISDLWDKAIFEDDFIFSELPNYLLFPTNEILSDRAYFRLNITIPNNYILVSFGNNIKNSKNNYSIIDKTTLSTSNFSINLLKDYAMFGIDGPKISFGALASRVNINQYTPIDSAIVFKNIISNVSNQMVYLDSILGYYPYTDFNVVITKDTLNNHVLNSRSTILIPYTYTIDTTEINNKILNGLVKQWFGNKINVKNEKDLWITKGFAKYMEWLVIEKKVGKVKFNKMMSYKLVEMRKYMGIIDWHQMNPYPIYSYDLNNVVYNFGELSKNKIIKGDEISFLFNVISLDTATVSGVIKNSFNQKFGHNINEAYENNHSYYELIKWAKEQGKGNFKISTDGYYTLKSMQNNEFRTYTYKLANPSSEFITDITMAPRGALFIHFLRLHFGDEAFFRKTLEFSTKYSGASLSTEFFVDELNKITNGEISGDINKWLYSDTEIPSLQTKHKN